jgi:hypothetical protein
MWVFHPEAGFFSVVADPAKPGRLVVRARVRQDLDNLARFLPRLTRTRETPDRDYPYRAWCSPAQWADAVARMAATITYTNFKSEVLRRQGPARERRYHRVWAVMLGAEQEVGD